MPIIIDKIRNITIARANNGPVLFCLSNLSASDAIIYISPQKLITIIKRLSKNHSTKSMAQRGTWEMGILEGAY